MPRFTWLQPCIAPAWARGAHAQTIFGHWWPAARNVPKGERVEIALPDGDRLVGYWREGASDTVVYLFHGLSGDLDADYIRSTAEVCAHLGHSVFRFNHRGCGEGRGLARHPYHSGRAEDLSAAIAFGRARRPKLRSLAIGFSLSGNALLLLLAGKRGRERPDYAISINAPIDLESASRILGQGLNRLYDARFVRRCRSEIAGRPGSDGYRIPRNATLREFDALYTAPAGQFRDREDYYAQCSTQKLLHRIDTPTLLFTAKDDPFVEYGVYREAELSPAVRLHAEDIGGHMGYLSARKTLYGTRRWLDYALWESIPRLLA